MMRCNAFLLTLIHYHEVGLLHLRRNFERKGIVSGIQKRRRPMVRPKLVVLMVIQLRRRKHHLTRREDEALYEQNWSYWCSYQKGPVPANFPEEKMGHGMTKTGRTPACTKTTPRAATSLERKLVCITIKIGHTNAHTRWLSTATRPQKKRRCLVWVGLLVPLVIPHVISPISAWER